MVQLMSKNFVTEHDSFLLAAAAAPTANALCKKSFKKIPRPLKLYKQ